MATSPITGYISTVFLRKAITNVSGTNQSVFVIYSDQLGAYNNDGSFSVADRDTGEQYTFEKDMLALVKVLPLMEGD